MLDLFQRLAQSYVETRAKCVNSFRYLKKLLFILCLHSKVQPCFLTTIRHSYALSVTWNGLIASFQSVHDNKCQVLQTSDSYVTTGLILIFVYSLTLTCILNNNDTCYQPTKISKTAKCDHFALLFCCAKSLFVFSVSGMRRKSS